MTGDPPPTGPAEHVGPAEHADPAQRFSDVFDVYFAEIHRYAAKRHGPDAAADVAAQAFLEAFRQRRRYDPHRASVRTWLYGIATKVIGRHQRAELRALRALARLSPDRDPSEHADQVDERVSAEGLPPTTRERAQARALIEPHRRTRLRLRWSLSAVAAVTAVGVAAAVAVTLTSGRVPPGATPPQKGNATAPQHPVNLGPKAAILLAATKAAQQPAGAYWHTDMVSGQSYIVRPASAARPPVRAGHLPLPASPHLQSRQRSLAG